MPPPPWKKARLSRMVSDHLSSPTHGGSLVVETGFPTSLVDLFVKNRHRMKKSSSKKNCWTTEVDSEPADSLFGGSPFLGEIFVTESVCSAITPRSSLDSLRSPRQSVSDSIPINKSMDQESCGETVGAASDSIPMNKSIDQENSGETVGVVADSILMNKSIDQENSGETVGGRDGRGAGAKGYFWFRWIFKVFFVVVLAMATKQLALGITASASSLLLMELFGNYILKPWLNARKSLKNNNHSSSIESQSKEAQIEEIDNCNADVVDFNVAETPNPEPNNTHWRGEIRAMKSILNSPRFHKRSASDGTGMAKDLHAFKSFNLNWFSLEESKECVEEKEDTDNQSKLDQIPSPPVDHVIHKSRSRKIKSKIKKFVKKLRSSKKEHTDRRSKASFAGSASESGSIPSLIKLYESSHQPIIDDDVATSILTDNSHAKEMEYNVGLSINAVEGRRRRKSSYCVAIFAVVLAGLVGGRLCGIVFTLIWCSAMKLIDKEGSIGKPPVD